jgi:hypothetical protein
MKEKKLFSPRELSVLPIGFQYFKKTTEPPPEIKGPPKTFFVEKYLTPYYRPSKFYKPISKIT